MIELFDLTKRYGTTVAVDGVSLTVPAGELLAVVGASGSGKTTLLKMVNRLVEPTSGRVSIGGEDTAGLEPNRLRRGIGYVFQQVGLFVHLTVAENIALPLTLARGPASRVRARVDELLDLVELPPATRDRRPADLSGGQQQRVGVARALATAPRVMLLDEPFGAIDPLTRDRLRESYLRIHRQLSLTALLVTHDIAEALLMGDRIAILRDGRVVQVGTPRALLRGPADEGIRRMLDTPLRQARLIDRLLEHRDA